MKQEESSNQRAPSPMFPGMLRIPSTPSQVIHLDSILNSESGRIRHEPDSPAFPGSEVMFREHPLPYEKFKTIDPLPQQANSLKLDKRKLMVYEKKDKRRSLVEDTPFIEKKGIQEIRKVYGKDAKLPVTPIEPGQRVVYVNALQYSAFCKFRIKKQKRKQKMLQKYGTDQVYKRASKTYMHESRHKHAKNRVRDKNGRFISKSNTQQDLLQEVPTTSDVLLKMLTREESETDHLEILNRMPDID